MRGPRDYSYIEHLKQRGCDISLLPATAKCRECGDREVWHFNVRRSP